MVIFNAKIHILRYNHL